MQKFESRRPRQQSVSNAYGIGSRSKCRDRGRHPCSRRRLRGGSSLSPGPTLGEGDDVSGNSFHDQTPSGKRNFPSRDKPAQLATAHDIERGETLPLVEAASVGGARSKNETPKKAR
jgi:hypothetical protein